MNKLFLVAILMLSFPAYSAIIDNSAYTTDTIGGLDWLDVSASAGRSYTDVSSNLVEGGDFEGWRYATSSEFIQLIDNYAETPFFSENQLLPLISMLGNTVETYYLNQFGMSYAEYHGILEEDALRYTLGFLGDKRSHTVNDGWLAIITSSSATAYHDSRNRDGSSYLVGSYLVRSSEIPAPAPLALLAIGLAGIGLTRKRKEV